MPALPPVPDDVPVLPLDAPPAPGPAAVLLLLLVAPPWAVLPPLELEHPAPAIDDTRNDATATVFSAPAMEILRRRALRARVEAFNSSGALLAPRWARSAGGAGRHAAVERVGWPMSRR